MAQPINVTIHSSSNESITPSAGRSGFTRTGSLRPMDEVVFGAGKQSGQVHC